MGTTSDTFCIEHNMYISPRYFMYHTCPLHTICESGKREAHIICSMSIPEKAAPVTGTTSKTFGPVPAYSRQ